MDICGNEECMYHYKHVEGCKGLEVGQACMSFEPLKEKEAPSSVSSSAGLEGPMAGWISVKDRLPEVGSAVIAAMGVEEERDGFEGWWFGCCIYREYGFPWVKFDNPHPIEYWMPMPEPPKAA